MTSSSGGLFGEATAGADVFVRRGAQVRYLDGNRIKVNGDKWVRSVFVFLGV